MQAVVASVDEQWESPLADELLQRWEHDSSHAKFWRASANFVCFFQQSGQRYVLRFNHASERTADAVRAEINYVSALAAQGLPVAKPVRSRAGNDVESIATAQGTFHAVVFEALPGKQLDLDELTCEQLVCWGKSLGDLHNAAARYTTPGRQTWEDQLAWVAEILPAEETVARQTLDRLKQELGQLMITPQNFGLIHYDFELDNLVWNGAQPGIIDFDDCTWDWFAADIAFALRDLFGDSTANVNLHDETFQHFITGYRRARPIDPEELRQIPLFLYAHHLFMYARLLRAHTPPDPAGELPWMPDLRRKLVGIMQTYRSEFSAWLAAAPITPNES